MNHLNDAYLSVHQKIKAACLKAGRPSDSVNLLAVSKTQNTDAIGALFELGQRDFGENQVQEALSKQPRLSSLPIIWHFIGTIQSNKTKALAKSFDWVHTLCRIQEAIRLNTQRPPEKAPLNVCLQVNIGNEAQKNGLSPEAILPLAKFIERQCPQLKLRGLMCIPPASTLYSEQLAYFEAMAALQHTLIQNGLPCDTLSMGMTDDMEAAIMAGSTWVRIGRGLFGDRNHD